MALSRLLRRRRPLRALQVEVTTRCTRRCAVCPRSESAGAWPERDLTAAAWWAIAPALGQAEHLHRQAWGEPLLNPDLAAMATEARIAGCTVGVTTNGDLLADAVEWLVASRVDLVTVSVAGATASHARLRDGSDLEAVLRSAAAVAARSRRGKPRVQLSFLLTGDNHGELEEVVRLAAAAGIPEVFAVHLDATPSPRLLAMAAFAADGLGDGVEESLARAHRAARTCGVRLRTPAGVSDLVTCALDPTRFAFVAADGRVGPCVYLLLPAAGSCPETEPAAVTATAFARAWASADVPLLVQATSCNLPAAKGRAAALREPQPGGWIMRKVSAALAMIVVASVATISFAGVNDTVRIGPPVAPENVEASEVYPVDYPGGPPPAPVLGELDADDGTYNRVVSCGTLSGVGTAVYYDLVEFTNSGAVAADVVAFTSTQGNPSTCPFDTFLTVYSAFNPADPLSGCVEYDDDGGVGACSEVSFQVPAGEMYTIVVTSFANGTTGAYQVNFDGTVPVELQSFEIR